MKKLFIISFLVLAGLLNAQIKHELLFKIETEDKILSSPVVNKGVVYFGSDDTYFYAANSSNGKIIWKFKTGGVIRGSAKIFDNKIAFVSGDGTLYALDKKSGKLIWKFNTRGEMEYDCWDYYHSTPEIIEDKLIFGSGDNHIYGLNKNTGKKIWEVKTGNVVHASPAVIGKNIFIGSFDGLFYSINSETGNINWKFDTIGHYGFEKGAIQGGASVLDNFLVFGSRDFNLYAVNSETGKGVFNKAIESWIVSRPTVHEKSIYFGNSDRTFLWAYNPYENGKDWKTSVSLNVFSDAVIYKDYVLFGSFNGKLYFVNQTDGKIVHTFSTEASRNKYKNIIGEDEEVRKELYDNLKTLEDYCKLYNDKFFSLGSIMGTPCVEKDKIFIPSTEGSIYVIEVK